MAKIIQYHSSVVSSDAIGNSILELDNFLQRAGVESYISCRDDQMGLAATNTIPVSSILKSSIGKDIGDSDILLIHYSFYDESAEALSNLPVRNVIVYHNITPSEYFRRAGVGWLADLCDMGRSQLTRMASNFTASVGDSHYNCDELRRSGYKRISRIPIMLKFEDFRSDRIDFDFLLSLKQNAEVNILFVGRFVPNKCVELVVSTLAAFCKAFQLKIVLHLVGKVWDQEYFSAIVSHAGNLGVASNVRFYHDVDHTILHTLFIASDAFVCMSDHEGFMVPIIEAFASGCPVIAVNSSAVGETMGGPAYLLTLPTPNLQPALFIL